MALVRNKLTRPGGEPVLTRVSVDVELVNGGWHGNPAETEIIGRVRVQPDGSGIWQLDLTPNGDISPAGSHYQAVEKVGEDTKIHKFVVPGPVAFTDGSRTSNVVTLTGLAAGHKIEVGDSVTVVAADATYDGTFTVTGPASPGTTLVYSQTAANDPSAGAGTATKAVWDLFDLLAA